MAGEGEKAVFSALAPYVAVIAGVGIILWWINNKFNIGANLTLLNKQLDQAATNYGQSTANAANDPRTEYDAARSAYAASIGWSISSQGFPTNWPSYADWISGTSPDPAYAYGSSAYPVPPSPSLLGSITQSLGL